mmetsp:Transcript_20257/g.60487  ORF Transcript_20257/g.60487 Transcript_20257/m.60487 type:complete len:314 (+) Transcript_20257:38-979(+)
MRRCVRIGAALPRFWRHAAATASRPLYGTSSAGTQRVSSDVHSCRNLQNWPLPPDGTFMPTTNVRSRASASACCFTHVLKKCVRIFLPSNTSVWSRGNAATAATEASDEIFSSLVSSDSSTTWSLSRIHSVSFWSAWLRRLSLFGALRRSRKTCATGSHSSSLFPPAPHAAWQSVESTGGTLFAATDVQRPRADRSRSHDLQTTVASCSRSGIDRCSRTAPKHSPSTTSNAPVPDRSSPTSTTGLGGGRLRSTAAARSARVGASPRSAARQISSSPARGHAATSASSGGPAGAAADRFARERFAGRALLMVAG